MASGQAVRRLTLDQEIVGSNPTSPAIYPLMLSPIFIIQSMLNLSVIWP